MSETETLVAVLGMVGAVTSSARALPQAIRALRLAPADLVGISRGTWALSLVSCVLWITWSFGVGAPEAGVSSFIAGPAALVVLARLRDRDRERRD